MQRHAILCGDSATFQGTERDIVFLSMVADPVHRTALTMLRYAQRFNVAVSRGRDRVVLVRSVRREDLNPTDLKARLIAHFENPMPLEKDSGDEGLAACDSGFERDLMQKLLDRRREWPLRDHRVLQWTLKTRSAFSSKPVDHRCDQVIVIVQPTHKISSGTSLFSIVRR
jgi:hypothetical protein